MVTKLLSCIFDDSFTCSFRKTACSCLMARCLECRRYKRFSREMLEADEKVMDEIDEERRMGVSE